jgi:ubiquinone biosynthesis protein COQ4
MIFRETFQQLKFARAFFTIVKDPEKTGAVFDVADAAPDTSPGLQHALSVAKQSPEFFALLKERFTPERVELSQLLSLPETSFGYAYAKHMTDNGLDPNFYSKPRGSSEVAYLKTRGRQTHDYWHIATGYGTDPWGEYALQSFMLGQFQPALSLIILGASLVRLAKTNPEKTAEYIELIISAYRRGQKATKLLGVKWEDEFNTPLHELREKLLLN